MNLLGLLDVSSSALKAERVRAEVVASNMENAETTRTPDGGAYRRHHVIFSQVDGANFGASLLRQGHGLLPTPVLGTMPKPLSGLRTPTSGSPATALGGVEVAAVLEDQGAPLLRFDPTHPDAGVDGYVAYPDINPLTEMVDLMGASRSYGLNASAIQAEKGMLASSLDLMKS